MNCFSQENLKKYYYPISDKREVQVYKYIDKNDSINVEYWKVISNDYGSETIKSITTVSYNSNLLVYNIFDEIIKEEGAELVFYADYKYNNTDKLTHSEETTIIDNDVYKWFDKTPYAYSVRYQSKFGKMIFTKTREMLGFEIVKVRGIEYESIKFKDDYSINAVDISDDYRFYQYTWYAKNIGMVKYRRFAYNKIIELELDEILTKKEFDKLLKKSK